MAGYTIDDVRKRREEKQISLQQAKAELRREHLIDRIMTAQTINDLRSVLLDIVTGGG